MKKLPVYWYLIGAETAAYAAGLIFLYFKINIADYLAVHLYGIKDCWQIWRFFTCLFVNYNLLSFFISMICLYFLGKMLLQFVSDSRFLSVYLLSAALGSAFVKVLGMLGVFSGGNFDFLYGCNLGILGLIGFSSLLLKEETLQIWAFILIPVKARVLWILAGLYCLFEIIYFQKPIFWAEGAGFIIGSVLVCKKLEFLHLDVLYDSFCSFCRSSAKKYQRRHLHLIVPEKEKTAEAPVKRNSRLDAVLKKLAEEGSRALNEDEKKLLELYTNNKQ